MLVRDPSKRFTADQALQHAWIRTMAAGAKGVLSTKIIENMQTFRSLNKLQKAIVMYIATQASEREVTRLRQIFTSLDKDGDGKLSMPEMREAFKLHKGIANLKELIESIDTDQSGYIDYSGRALSNEQSFWRPPSTRNTT